MLALLADLGWKSALIAGLALLANHLLRRRAPGERVVLLRAAVAALLLMPLLLFSVPELEIAVLPAIDAAPAPNLVMANVAVASAAFGEAGAGMPLDWLSILYLAGAGLLLLRLAVGLSTLWRWTHHAEPARDPCWTAAMRAAGGLRRPVRLLVSPHVAAPMSWGLAPAWVLIGPATERSAEQAEAVIAHELAHVRRFDWPMLVAAQLATLFFWFNPLVWLLARELARQTELAADEEAIHYVARADYAQTLLSMAGGAAHPVACGMSITHSAIGRRICCVLDADAARPASRLVCVALLAGMLLVATPLTATQLVHATSPAAVQVTSAAQSFPDLAASANLPAIVLPARASDTTVVERPRTSSRQVAPSRARLTVDAIPATRARSGEEEASQIAQQHAGLTIPSPRPGTQAAAWNEAISGPRRDQIETRGRAAAVRAMQVAAPVDKAKDRDLALAMTEAAKGLRLRAQELEAIAADGAVAKEIRGAHARAAGSLRNQAEKLDIEARQKLFGG